MYLVKVLIWNVCMYLSLPCYIIEFKILLLVKYFIVTFVTSNITIMNTRLKQFLDAENISQSQFADTIKVVRASVSHVLSGRNNPSYEFIRAIMNSYPELNIEWLMLGKGKMYKTVQTELPATPVQPQMQSLFFEDEDLFEAPQTSAQESNIPAQLPTPSDSAQTSSNMNTLNDIRQSVVKQRNVSKIIIMFDDGTFQEM